MKNNVVVVIGGTGGIGFAVCKNLFESGNIVYLVGRNKDETLKKTREIDSSLKGIFFEIVDVFDEVRISKLFKKIILKHKKINAVINSSGVFEPFGEFETVSLKKHLKPLEVNLIGTMKLAHKLLPIFKKQKFGKIILFSGGGVGGDTPLINASSYFVSKAAISVFAEVLGKETESKNIQINAVLPSQILTKSTKKTFKVPKEKLGAILAPATESLLSTGGNSVDRVLRLIEFLVSDESNHISGRTLSAKWDDVDLLKKKLPEERFKLRRIDGKVYKKTRL